MARSPHIVQTKVIYIGVFNWPGFQLLGNVVKLTIKISYQSYK